MSGPRLNRVARDLAVEQSLDAAIELDEVIKHKREDAPALINLVTTLMGSRPGERPDKRDLLSNSQMTSLYYRAAAARDGGRVQEDIDSILSLFLDVNSIGLPRISGENLAFMRDFCLGLNRELVTEAFDKVPEPPFVRTGKNELASINEY